MGCPRIIPYVPKIEPVIHEYLKVNAYGYPHIIKLDPSSRTGELINLDTGHSWDVSPAYVSAEAEAQSFEPEGVRSLPLHEPFPPAS